MTYRLIAACALFIAGCGVQSGSDGPPTRDRRVPNAVRVPQPEPRSASGNPRFYDVYGQRYYVMQSADTYKERGVASWYGKKFHGRLTSSGEVYDMHAVSAAHKTLPLPTWVKVTNLSNGRSVVLRVNDRGPFVDNRLIDLSYAAARELDLISAGTGLVEVEAINLTTATDQPADSIDPIPDALFMQIGAFSDAANAARLQRQAASAIEQPVFINEAKVNGRRIYRVQIGPVDSVADYDQITRQLADLSIRKVQLVGPSSGAR